MIRSFVFGAFAFGTLAAASLGCRTAANAIPGFKWGATSNRVPAEASVATGEQPLQSAAARLSAPTAGSSTVGGVSVAGTSPKEDPLHGFYPEDLPESTNSTTGGFVSGGFSSGTGSFASGSSSGCTSGCCPH